MAGRMRQSTLAQIAFGFVSMVTIALATSSAKAQTADLADKPHIQALLNHHTHAHNLSRALSDRRGSDDCG